MMSSEHDHCPDCQKQYSQYLVPVIITCCRNIICRACAYYKWVHGRWRCWYPQCSNTNILTLRCSGSFTPPYTDVGHLDQGEEGIVMINIDDLNLKYCQMNNIENTENDGSVAQPCNYSKSKRTKSRAKIREVWYIWMSGDWLRHTPPPSERRRSSENLM